MIFLEFSKRFFTFYFWELECFFVLKRCFSLRPFQWYILYASQLGQEVCQILIGA